ncbi:MAG: EI24 domain-containing protein [Roseovarius sp.]|uniref:EI24 domain-containing protein n=1 Tax=Roseovarius sp. TaxID=1486281 RepID=UPI0032EC3413
MIFSSFFKALGQLGDPRFRKVLFLGIGLTLALLIATYAGLLAVIEWLTGETTNLPIVGEVTWVGDLLSFGSLFLMLFLSAFLMVPVASAITSMFLDEVAQAVEDRHYPRLPPANRVPFGEAVKDTINFLGIIIAANLLALFLYVAFTPAAPFIFYAMNGYLLGMEYFTLVAIRRVGRQKAKEQRRRHVTTIWLAGILMALPLSIPLINLIIPILGAATFTHIYHRLSGNA